MTAVVYGKLAASPASLIPTRDYPVVPPIPSADSPTPRRRRTTVCSSVTINGEHWDVDEAKAKMRAALRGDHADIRCGYRPGVVIASDYANDVCLSSWCRSCPFAVAEAKPAPVVRYAFTLPAPVLAPPAPPAPLPPYDRTRDRVYRQALATRIREHAAQRGLTLKGVSLALGMSKTYVQNAIEKLAPGPLQRTAAYLATIPKLPPPPKPVAFSEMSPEMHAARIRASIEALGMTYFDASRIVRMGDSFVANVLRRLGPLDRLEELDAVLDAMLAARRTS